jgi:hypothetical protein
MQLLHLKVLNVLKSDITPLCSLNLIEKKESNELGFVCKQIP